MQADTQPAIFESGISIAPIVEEIFCDINSDCISTTYCCSDYSCVHPSKCLHGQKVTHDTCDYNFECYTRCCASNVCSHFLNCYQTCKTNSDCSDTGCCSEGFCTANVVCDGNKVIRDYCDAHSECLSNYCNPITHQCSGEIVEESISVVGIIGIALSTIIVVIFITYCVKAISAHKSSNYFSANQLNGSNDRTKDGVRLNDKFSHQNLKEDSSESDLSEEASR